MTVKPFLKAVTLFLSVINVSGADTIILSSQNLPEKDTVLVFSPKKQIKPDPYPCVFLLHGLNGNYSSWNNYLNLQNFADSLGFVIICPDGLRDSYYLNSPKIDKMQYIDFFYTDLLPVAIQKYAIDTLAIFITGNSMGAHGALLLFFNNPDKYIACGSISGLLDLSNSSNKNNRLKQLIGEYALNKHLFQKYSALYIIDSINAFDTHLVIHCGTEDHFYYDNEKFVNKCKSYGIDYLNSFSSGGHNQKYWNQALKNQLLIFNKLYQNKNNCK